MTGVCIILSTVVWFGAKVCTGQNGDEMHNTFVLQVNLTEVFYATT